MKNTIADRVYDFLKKYPPFDIIKKEDLITIAENVIIAYLEKGKVLFKNDDNRHEHFYIVKEGGVVLKKNELADAEIIDICDEGDVFGLRPLITNDSYMMTAIAEEEALVYGIPIEVFKPILAKEQNVGLFLIESFTSKTKNPFTKKYSDDLYQNTEALNVGEKDFQELQVIRYTKDPFCIDKDDLVIKAATRMSENKVGSLIVVDDDNLPIGILTDKDFRHKIVTGMFSTKVPVSQIMSFPVETFKKTLTVTEAQLAMVKNKTGHLVITEDGTDQTKAIGILTEHDVVISQGNSASGLMKAIRRSRSSKELRKIRQQITQLLKGYIFQNIPLTIITQIIHELNEALTIRVIEIALDRMPEKPPVQFAWLSLGSHGRKEQLLVTDQDNALVFEDVPEDKYEEVKKYFLILATKVNILLNKVGYEFCPADMMARNPKWCQSLTEWKTQFSHWIHHVDNEDILYSSIFFDFNRTYGNKEIVKELSDSIFSATEYNPLFFTLMGRSALQNPSPLGFFRQFLVEQDGEHKDMFDIKARALMPLIDGARILILSHKIKSVNNTAERYERLAELEPANKDFYLSCSYAVKALIKFRTKHGLLYHSTGRYIVLKELTKEERLKLKRCFKTISELQELIKIRFKVAQFL
ncbi:DUF294 nucleotidyltransferase-like domain-containing protein [Neptunitalea lumnitzerae]|uniref:CBS domain-containing protein n=1 Tax=Neptunitalea lumnitzerae TaxID=2965509 RepID=A0ABQ5MKZ5_9FLAO|nr:DUF294 nucleotidyltransferase-like domain-containing protein [Neptunitalea sp. Y10]GLB50076.1 hypothetical protein Y10_24440 [Neptunitalea sp. Y10]